MQRPRETLFLGLFFIPAPRYIPRLDKFSSVRVGTYGIRSTNKSVRVGAYCIRPTNRSTRVGAYGIHTTNRFVRVGTYGIRVTNRSVRVGAYCIRPTNRSVRVGAYCIRPTNASAWRRMTDKPGGFWGVCNTPLPIPIKNLIPIY